MRKPVALTIDGVAVEAPTGSSVMDACDLAGIYVPRLCAYPGLEPVGDCGLCFVRVSTSGADRIRRACSVEALAGMVVETRDAEALASRRASMESILGDHPHVCLICPERDGCGRDRCTFGHPPEQRCCAQFGRCEVAGVAEYVGALEAAPEYRCRGLGTSVERHIKRDLDLCIGCGRCVEACATLVEAGAALRLVQTARLAGNQTGDERAPRSYLGRRVAVSKREDLVASGCTFCGACVMVCPTGALDAEGAKGDAWLAGRRERTTLLPGVLPPEGWVTFSASNVARVPSREGVYRLFSSAGEVLRISGVPDLRSALQGLLAGPQAMEVAAFAYEEDPMFTLRESELLARHLQKHGAMPRADDITDALFGDEDDVWL